MLKLILGGIIGAAIAFAWSFVSWAVLPWHEMAMNKFTNQEFVSWVIKENAPKDGVYIAPYYESSEINLTPDEIKHNIAQQKKTMNKGPFVYAQVKTKGINPANLHRYTFSYLTQFIGAVLISLLLLQASGLRYGGRLLFVTGVGLVVGILGFIPGWNWFGAGYKFTLVMIADLVVTWFLAGLFLAAYVRPQGDDHERELMM